MYILSIFESLQSVWGTFAWLTLIVLPGAWITFGIPVEGLSVRTRILIGITLGPLVVGFQFYMLRIVGFSFDQTMVMLVLLNIPALFLVWKRRKEIKIPKRRVIIGVSIVMLVAVIGLAPQLLDSNTRSFTGHAWMHADLIYLFANGELIPDDPELVGVRLAYPWIGHIYQASLSYFLDTSPASNYIWTNLIWLFCIYGLLYSIVGVLGGNRFSQITSLIWLCFGLNFVGFVLALVFPEWLAEKLWIGGDYRSSPWILKFYFFEQIIFGLGMFSALILSLIKESVNNQKLPYFFLVAVLLTGVGIVYPILFIPAVFSVLAKLAFPVIIRSERSLRNLLRHSTGVGIAVVISGIASALHLVFITRDRITPSIKLPSFSIAFAKYSLLKGQGTLVAMSLLLVLFLFTVSKCWKTNRSAVFVLVFGAAGSIFLNLFLEIPYWGNEYKFLFTAAICLSPFAGIALEPLVERLKWNAIPVFGIITFLLAAPLISKILLDYPWHRKINKSDQLVKHPLIDVRKFEMRLDTEEPMSELCDVLLNRTTKNTILVADTVDIHLPTLTRRRLFSPPEQEEPRPGINMSSSDLLADVRGYGRQIVVERRSIVEQFYNSTEDTVKRNALDQILVWKRPVAIILEFPRNTGLNDWLNRERKSSLLWNNDHYAVWVVQLH